MAIGQGFHAKPSPTLGSLPAGLKWPESLVLRRTVSGLCFLYKLLSGPRLPTLRALLPPQLAHIENPRTRRQLATAHPFQLSLPLPVRSNDSILRAFPLRTCHSLERPSALRPGDSANTCPASDFQGPSAPSPAEGKLALGHWHCLTLRASYIQSPLSQHGLPFNSRSLPPPSPSLTLSLSLSLSLSSFSSAPHPSNLLLRLIHPALLFFISLVFLLGALDTWGRRDLRSAECI